jgi:hypothetical protein
MLPPSSRLKCKPSKQAASNPEDGGMLLRNIGWLPPDYTALYPRTIGVRTSKPTTLEHVQIIALPTGLVHINPSKRTWVLNQFGYPTCIILEETI